MKTGELLTPTERVRRIARWTRGLALIGGAGTLAATIMLWTLPQFTADIATRMVGLSLSSPVTITPAARWAAACIVLAPVIVGLFGFLQVWQLFGDYGRGAIFTASASLRLRRLAWSAIAVSLLQILARTGVGLALTLGNPPGQRLLLIDVGSSDYVLLLFGLLLLAIAWVMVDATRLAQENAEFV